MYVTTISKGLKRMAHIWMGHIRIWSYMWHDSFVNVTWFIHIRERGSRGNMGNCSYMNGSCTYMITYVTWLICKCDMIYSCMWVRLQREYGEWLIYEWVMSRIWSCMWRDSFINFTWFIHACEKGFKDNQRNGSYMNGSCHVYDHVCDVTLSEMWSDNESLNKCEVKRITSHSTGAVERA